MIISHFKPGDEKSTGKTNKLNELKIGLDYTVKRRNIISRDMAKNVKKIKSSLKLTRLLVKRF